MSDLKNEKYAIPVVILAGLIWSFGPLVVRNIDSANLVPWQYLFARGIVIFILLNLYLFFEEGKEFYKNYFKAGFSGLVGGLGLGSAMITFIWSITNTSAAITLLCLSAMPFITALLGFLFLKEKISSSVWIAISVASIGVAIMGFESFSQGAVFGLLFGLISALGFSIFSVSLRWKKDTPKFTTVAIAGMVCFLFSTIVIIQNDLSFLSSSKNESLFALHGTLVCLGLILYSMGSKTVPAAELTLLSLTEVIQRRFKRWSLLKSSGVNLSNFRNKQITKFVTRKRSTLAGRVKSFREQTGVKKIAYLKKGLKKRKVEEYNKALGSADTKAQNIYQKTLTMFTGKSGADPLKHKLVDTKFITTKKFKKGKMDEWSESMMPGKGWHGESFAKLKGAAWHEGKRRSDWFKKPEVIEALAKGKTTKSKVYGAWLKDEAKRRQEFAQSFIKAKKKKK